MRRSISLSLALLLLAAAASPALAARSGGNFAKRGTVTITIFNTRGNPSLCSAKVVGQGLADGQSINLTAAPYNGTGSWTVGNTNASGTVDPTGDTNDGDSFDTSHTGLVAYANSYAAILDVNGDQAAWSVNNSCRPA